MAKNKESIIERVLQSNFKTRAIPGISEQWRTGLSRKINELEPMEALKEEILFIKYENCFWRMAWISFAASLLIFISLMYHCNRQNSSQKNIVSKQIYECLSMGDKL